MKYVIGILILAWCGTVAGADKDVYLVAKELNEAKNYPELDTLLKNKAKHDLAFDRLCARGLVLGLKRYDVLKYLVSKGLRGDNLCFSGDKPAFRPPNSTGVKHEIYWQDDRKVQTILYRIIDDEEITALRILAESPSTDWNVFRHADYSDSFETVEAPLSKALRRHWFEGVAILAQKAKKNSCGLTDLHLAVLRGDVKDIVAILKSGADANARSQWGHTPFILAYGCGHDYILDILVKYGANPCLKTDDSPLHWSFHPWEQALIHDGLDRIKHLKRLGADKGFTAEHLLKSVTYRYRWPIPNMDKERTAAGLELIKMAVEGGVSKASINRAFLNEIVYMKLLAFGSKTRETLSVKDFPILELLLKSGADLNCANKGGLTGVYVAIELGSVKLFEEFKAMGGICDVVTKDGRTLMHAAIESGSLDMVKHMKKNGLDFSAKVGGMNMLYYAYRSGDREVITYLKSKGLSLKDGALNGAVEMGRNSGWAWVHPDEYPRMASFQSLLGRKWGPAKKEENLRNWRFRKATIEELLRAPTISLNMVGPKGTPLQAAVSRQDLATVKLLLAKVADPNKGTPLNHAIDRLSMGSDETEATASVRKQRDIVETLLKGGATPNATKASTESEPEEMPLVRAAKVGRLDVVKVLLKYKAKGGKLAAYYALDKGRVRVAKYLMDNGIKLPRTKAGEFVGISDPPSETIRYLTGIKGGITTSQLEYAAAYGQENYWTIRKAGVKPTKKVLLQALKSGDFFVIADAVKSVAKVDLKTGKVSAKHKGFVLDYLLVKTCDTFHENELVAKILLKLGADREGRRSRSKTTPLLEATHSGNHRIMRLLLKYQARVDAMGESGVLFNHKTTALHAAIRRKDVNAVEILLDYGAKPNTYRDSGKKTPWQVALRTKETAKQNKYDDTKIKSIIGLLEEAMANLYK